MKQYLLSLHYYSRTVAERYLNVNAYWTQNHTSMTAKHQFATMMDSSIVCCRFYFPLSMISPHWKIRTSTPSFTKRKPTNQPTRLWWRLSELNNHSCDLAIRNGQLARSVRAKLFRPSKQASKHIFNFFIILIFKFVPILLSSIISSFSCPTPSFKSV